MQNDKENCIKKISHDAKVSVIMPNRNHGKYLHKSLGGILAQSKKIDEIIIYDDGSTDDSVDILKNYAKKNNNIKLITNDQSVGVIANLNRGLFEAEGDYILFAAADDYLYPHFIEEAIKIHQKYPESAFVCARVDLYFDESKKIKGTRPILLPSITPCFISPDKTKQSLVWGDNYFLGTVTLHRTCLLKDYGGFDDKLLSLTDSYLSRLLACKHGFCFLPQTFAFWRLHKNNYSKTTFQSKTNVENMLYALRDAVKSEGCGVFPVNYDLTLTRRIMFALLRQIIQDDMENSYELVWQLSSLVDNTKTNKYIRILITNLGPLKVIFMYIWLYYKYHPYSFYRLSIEPLRRLFLKYLV